MTTETAYERTVSLNFENATYFDPKEAPPRPRKDFSEMRQWHYKVLELLNRGTHERKNDKNYLFYLNSDKSKIYLNDNIAIYDSIASRLDIHQVDKERGRNMFARLDFSRFSAPKDEGGGVALVAFCVCSFVRWQGGGKTHPNHPERENRFKQLQDEMEWSDKRFRTWYGRLESELRKEGLWRGKSVWA